MKKALIIETGELLDIKFHHKNMKFEFELPKELGGEIEKPEVIPVSGQHQTK